MLKTWINKNTASHLLPRSIEVILILSMALLCLMSVLALFTTQWTLIKDYDFSFSPAGLSTYISAFGNYGALFAGTVAVTVAYFGLGRLDAAIEANKLKEKYDRLAEWRMVLDVRFAEIQEKNPYMKREFIRLRFKFFNALQDKGFGIANKEQLIEVFDVFKTMVPFFEEQNQRYMELGGVFLNKTSSYSFDSFRFLFISAAEDLYEAVISDLKELYIEALPETRTVDERLYWTSVETASQRHQNRQ